MCEAVILSRCSRKNLYVPNTGNRTSFRSENQLFRTKASGILALFNEKAKSENSTKASKSSPVVS